MQFGAPISVKKTTAELMAQNLSATQLAQQMKEQMEFPGTLERSLALTLKFCGNPQGDKDNNNHNRHNTELWMESEGGVRDYVAHMHLIRNNNHNGPLENVVPASNVLALRPPPALKGGQTTTTTTTTTTNFAFNPFSNQNDRKLLIDRLAYQISRDLNSNAVCMSTAIVSMVLLTHGRYGILREDLVDKYVWLSDRITERGGWIDPILHPTSYVVDR